MQAVRPTVLEGVWHARGAGAGARRPSGPLPVPCSHGDEGTTLVRPMSPSSNQPSVTMRVASLRRNALDQHRTPPHILGCRTNSRQSHTGGVRPRAQVVRPLVQHALWVCRNGISVSKETDCAQPMLRDRRLCEADRWACGTAVRATPTNAPEPMRTLIIPNGPPP